VTQQPEQTTPPPLNPPLARVALFDVSEGGAIALEVLLPSGRENVIVTRRDDKLSAFINRCPHARWPLDTFDGRFLFTPDGHLMCAAHSAIFDPETGACLGGPGTGTGLTRVQTRDVEGGIEVVGLEV
jgi:nitrite reductase/ring-hydroxylating ferredoxin subunit